MKTVLAFIILCCYSQEEGGMYSYEARSLSDSTNLGTLHSSEKYSEGDTVFFDGRVGKHKPK